MDLQQGDYDLRSPMHLAAAEGHFAAVSFLLDAGVSPNQPDRWGGTPLEDARNGGHDEVAELLRKHDAQEGGSKHISSKGESDHAVMDGDPDMIVELLWAAAEGNIRGLQGLIAQGMNVNSADYDGRTALHLAAAEGRHDNAELRLGMEAAEHLVALEVAVLVVPAHPMCLPALPQRLFS